MINIKAEKPTSAGDIQQLERLYNRVSELVNDLDVLRDELEILKSEVDKPEPKEENDYKRWRADEGKEYYLIDSLGAIISNIDYASRIDNFRYEVGNYFKTQEEAQEYIENLKTKQELKDIALELNKGQEIDWKDECTAKYYLHYRALGSSINMSGTLTVQNLGQVYCLDKDFLTTAIERIGEERLIKLIKSGV